VPTRNNCARGRMARRAGSPQHQNTFAQLILHLFHACTVSSFPTPCNPVGHINIAQAPAKR